MELTARERDYLIGVLSREINLCGLDTFPGTKAASLRLRLTRLYTVKRPTLRRAKEKLAGNV
jgi:hypothetical protein